jgi:phosphatidylinositol glycan class S
VAKSDAIGLTLWEFDRLSRERTLQNMLNAVATLNSLATLIEDLENMVVLDHIRDKVIESLTDLKQVSL